MIITADGTIKLSEKSLGWLARFFAGFAGSFVASTTKFVKQDMPNVLYDLKYDPGSYYVDLYGALITSGLIMFACAVTVAFLNENMRYKLFIAGVCAPAYIASLTGGSSFNDEVSKARQAGRPSQSSEQKEKDILMQPAPKSLSGAAVGPGMIVFFTTFLADASGPTIFDGILKSLGLAKPKYWVIVATESNIPDAISDAQAVNSEDNSLHAFVGQPQPDSTSYPVIIGDYSDLEDAQVLVSKARNLQNLPSAKNAYLGRYSARTPAIWTKK